MKGVLTKNFYDEGLQSLAMLSDGSNYLNVPVLLSKEVLCRRATVIDPLLPYKTMTSTFEGDASLLKISDLAASDPKLIDCKGASHIALHVLAPEEFVLASFNQSGVWAGFVVGYVAQDASKDTFCPVYVEKIYDRTFASAGQRDVSQNNQFIKTTIGGKVFAVSATDYIPTMGFEKVQLIFCNSYFEMGVEFAGTINVYCVAV